MDTARQTIRWGIPGWSFVILLVLFVMMASAVRIPIVAITTGRLINLQSIMAREPLLDVVPSTTFAVGIAGIPIGAVIYQFYFWFYWRVRRTCRGGWWVSVDRGHEILRELPVLDVLHRSTGRALIETPEPEIREARGVLGILFPWIRVIPPDQAGRWKRRISERSAQEGRQLNPRRQLELDYQDNWTLANFAWYTAIGGANVDASSAVADQCYILDTYHSLGAIRFSLLFAFLAYVGYAATAHIESIYQGVWLHYLLPVLVNLVIGALCFKMLTTVRRRALYQLIKYMRDRITCFGWREQATE